MKLLSSWFRIHRTLGLALLVTATCCALSNFGGLTRTASAQKAQPTYAPALTASSPARKVALPVPDYTVTTSSGASIVPGTTDIGNHVDDFPMTPITLPFPVVFYDQVFTSANVSANGNLEFSSSSETCCTICVPDSSANNLIAPGWTDLYTIDAAAGQGIFTSVSGSAPNRIFNIEWRAKHCCSFGPPTYNFEVRLYEGQRRIDFIYGALESNLGGIGVQRDTGSHSTVVSCGSAPAAGTQYTFTIPPPSSCIPAPENMIGWWRAEGNANDSQDDNNGTLNGGVIFATGEVGQAFSFDGSTGYVFVPDSPSLNYTDFTYDAWIAPDPSSPAGDNYIIHKGVVAYYVPLIYIKGGAGAQSWTAIIDSVSLNGGPVTYGFQHVAVTREGNVGKLYVDGVLQDTQTVGTGSAEGDNLTFGRITNFGSSFFKGRLDEVEVFNRALTATEIASIYIAGSFGKCPCTPPPEGMVSWWRAEGDAVDTKDGNDGTLQGTVDFVPAEVGQGFIFDSDDDGVVIQNNSNLDITSSGFTADFWMKGTKNQPSSTAAIFEKSHGFVDATGWAFQVDNSSGNPSFALGDGSGFPQIGAAVDVLDGSFHHITGTWSSSDNTMRFYVDGALQGTASNSSPANNTRTLNIGFAWGGGTSQRFFRGIADELEVFNRALTGNEVAAIFNAGSVGKCRSCTPAPGGMISWWKAEGDAKDSQDHNNGTLQDGATFAPGRVGQAFSLNGEGQYVDVADTPNLSITGPFTIDAWINTNDNTSEHAIVEKYDGGGMNGYFLRLESETGRLVAGTCDASSCAFVVGVTQVTTGTFHHVAAVFDGTNLSVYLDGVVDAAGTGVMPTDGTNPLEIGARGGSPANFFNGLIDEVEIFDRALTANEVRKIFDAGSAGKCPCVTPPNNMIAWWPGDDTAADIIGGHNGTLNDATFAPGEVSDAFNFDGQDDSVSIPPSNDWNFGTGEFTFDFWARANPAPIGNTAPKSSGRKQGNANPNTNRMHALSFEPDPTFATRNLDFNFNDGGVGLFLFWNGGGGNSIQVGTTGQYTDGQWHHFALTRTATELKVRNGQAGNWTLYIDGAVAGTASYSGALDLSGGSNNYIGASTGQVTESRFFWDGQIDEVEIFNRALRADEVAAIYNAGGAGKCKPQAPDLTGTKTNNVGGNTTAGTPWTWKISVANGGASAANFTSGQTILNDNLPNNFIIYGSPSVGNVVNVTNSSAINCTIVSSNLTCTASGAVSIAAGGSFDVSFTTIAGQGGTYVNPRAGGGCSVDPNNVVDESNETNNTCNDTVTVTGRPSPTPSPTPTPTPTPTATVSPGTTGTDVDGNGTIAGPHGGQATFSMSVKLQQSGKRAAVTGNFTYNDPASHVSINQSNVSSLTINGNHAHFTGPQRVGRRGSTVSFTVDVTDNGTPGNNDFFSIQLSNGYSASGNLTTGDIQIH